MSATTPNAGPLTGVRVVDLTINVLGPAATMILGDMGAEVVKVETPDGDPNRRNGPTRSPDMAAMFLNMNRNKRSVTLNLKRPEAREALMRLVDEADVFVHSMRPAAAQRLGISYEEISRRNRRIVYGYGCGYMPGGPRENDPAFDDVVQGEAGIADLMLRSLGQPRYLPTVLVDKFCGYQLASAIGMALFARERTGLGQLVRVPMLETTVAFTLMEHLWGAAFEPPTGGGIGYVRLLTEHRRPYETKDGYICVLAVNDEQWQRLLPAMGRPELVQDERFRTVEGRIRNIDTVYGLVSEIMKTRTTAEWHGILDAIDIPNGAMARFEEMLADPYLNEIGFFHRYEHPTEGSLLTTCVPTQFSQTPGGVHRPPPRLGQHNAEVFGRLGYGADEIASLTA
ncbi:CaiB/BaiF CoA-transferase family protein [Ideonella sp. B508-1]|uniref:CaiB/BaiF CoA transferase family protein n=1 Tax=Ideonella sp. B508-1 TaxID=137716 RepID=UPI0003B75160|nr:CoA transferase [Ideonella sp. B508-1]